MGILIIKVQIVTNLAIPREVNDKHNIWPSNFTGGYIHQLELQADMYKED